MATILQMSQETAAGYHIASPSSRGRYPTASLSEVASAALANVGTSSSSDSSQSSHHGQSIAGHDLSLDSRNGSQRSRETGDISPKSARSAQKQQDVSGIRLQRPVTPEKQITSIRTSPTSPTSNDSPRQRQGAKRTASGAVKTVSNGYTTAHIGRSTYAPGHARAKSSSRAAEISSALKTRLKYAMVKVNHGWENHSLDQLENISRGATPSVSSPSTTSPRRRRFSLHSEYNDHYVTSPDVHKSPAQYSPGFVHHVYPRYSPPMVGNSSSTLTVSGTPALAPAAPIAPGRSHRRSQSTRAPPTLSTRGVDAYSQPTTPQRQGILRMPSQQAEKDALDSLLFMASPNNSSCLKYTDSPAGPSPLRSEFSQSVKRVVFES
ncbi:uncharacterized protein PV09_00591 [Verruconis gallopava]|uniref:Cyclin-dependent kinase n=1 Tax=Verruconis gallopava TaxID=253628 RepID=A0A0D2AQ53_9PEZI|nr:uncharacterized protein PV09_00591 [Verruconis gallopava]KIW08635.1 hypothetical protein PV09_00591 [Verruconis gallopava]